MSTLTTFLSLLKKNPETDGSDTFNIQTMLNENWDKIDGPWEIFLPQPRKWD